VGPGQAVMAADSLSSSTEHPTPMSTNDGLLPNWPDEWSGEEIVQRWEALLLVLTGCNRMADETILRHTLACLRPSTWRTYNFAAFNDCLIS
jgi:hypothetical protein